MSAHTILTLGNHQKERIQHSEHGESLKSGIMEIAFSQSLGIKALGSPFHV